MNSSTKARVLSFDSVEYPIPMCEEEEDRAGQLASAIRIELSKLGVDTIDDQAHLGEGLWVFRIGYGGNIFDVSVGVFPVGENAAPRWATSFIPKRTGWLSFRRPKGTSDEFEHAVSRSLQRNLGCFDLQWLGNDEFLKRL